RCPDRFGRRSAAGDCAAYPRLYRFAPLRYRGYRPYQGFSLRPLPQEEPVAHGALSGGVKSGLCATATRPDRRAEAFGLGNAAGGRGIPAPRPRLQVWGDRARRTQTLLRFVARELRRVSYAATVHRPSLP